MNQSVLAIALMLPATVAVGHDTHDMHGEDMEGSIVIESVVSGGPAEAARLKVGDVLIRIAGHKVVTHAQLKKVLGAHQPGDTVPFTVKRDGEEIDLALTFGERAGGGVSVGISMRLTGMGTGDPGEGTAECLAWIDATYRIDSMMHDLGLELSKDYEEILTCVAHDTDRMGAVNAVKYCDNVFKVHCSAVDLLMEIAEAQVGQCEEQLGESLGLKLQQYKGWRTCAEPGVFDRYSMKGESIDEATCKAAFLDECGTNIDTAIKAGEISPEQKDFAACCSADALDPECGMIDDGFSRGPCHDRSVCVNRETSEWIHCSVLG